MENPSPWAGSAGDVAAQAPSLAERIDRLEARCAALAAREKMYRWAAQISGCVAWSTDPAGKLTDCSQPYHWMPGAGGQAPLKEDWLDSVHADDRERVRKVWQHSLATGEPFSMEFRALRPDGSVRRVLARAAADRDDSGAVTCWYGITEDIHDASEADRVRTEMEMRLRESEELHRFTLELTRQIVWSIEPDGTGLNLSPRYFEVTGMDPSESPELSIHPEDREHIVARTAEGMATGEPFVEELRLRCADGSYRFHRMRAAPLRAGEGRIVRWYGVTEDIHEERLAELARQEVEQRYRLAARATNDIVWDYDLQGDVLEWSDNSAEFFGLEAPVGPTRLSWWRDRIHPEDRDRIWTTFQQAIESGKSHWSGTYRLRGEDGRYADIFDRCFIMFGPGGEPVRAVGAMGDLTQLHKAEEEVRMMQAELIHVSRMSAMGAMASTLAHELNQPLAAISNFVSGARRIASARGAADPDLVGALEAAASGAQRAGEIVRRLRELVSRGSVSVVAEHLPRLIEDASVLAFVDERKLGIAHRLQLDPKAQWVRVDRIQIQQVLINLVRNGIDAMARSARREIVISTQARGDMVEIVVADSGTGIAPEHFESLFSRFMTTKSGGMGIGLPISRTIVELHGGKIWAENRPQGGAAFHFTLPVAPPPGAPQDSRGE